MSVLIFVILTLGYVHVSEPKEQLSLTDFLLDFLLSLWVPPNYAPSKFTRSIHDPTAKEQMISIEKSQIALDNYIKHLMRYARENYSKTDKSSSTQEAQAQASSIINSNLPAYPCNEPYHGHYYTNFGSSLNTAESQTIGDSADNFPNQIYDIQSYPTYEIPSDGMVNGGTSGNSNVNMCPPPGSMYSQYPFGCQTKRNVRWDEGILGQYPAAYADVKDNGMYKFAKQMWYPNRDNRQTKNMFNRFYGAGKSRAAKDSEMSPSVPMRQTSYIDHMMSAQENIKKKIAFPKKGTKETETRLFEDFYLPGFLDELGNNQPPEQISHPVYNFPPKYYKNQYTDVTDAVVANRMLDAKLGNQGSLLNAMTRIDHQKTTPPQMDEPEKKIEKKSENSSVLPFTPTHRFGDIQTNSNKSEKEFALGHVIKSPEEKKR